MTLFETLKKEFRLLFLVCAAFGLMAAASYIYVSIVMKKQVVLYSHREMQVYRMAIKELILAHEAALTHAAASVRREIRFGASPEKLQALLKMWTEVFRSQPDMKDFFVSVYGYLNGNYLDGTSWIPGEFYSPKTAPWLRGAVIQNGIFHSKPYMDPRDGKVVSALSMVVFDEKGESLGVIAIDYLLNPIVELVRAYKIADTGYGVLLDGSFNILTCPEGQYIGKPINELPGYEGMDEKIKQIDGGVLVENIVSSGMNNIVFFSRLENGWYLGLAAPLQYFYREVFSIMPVIGALAAILSLTLCYTLYRLDAAKLRSEEESRAKSSFLARMSHEIRTPLNAVLGLSEIELQNGISGETPGNLEKIHSSGTTLLHIINDILDISKIESGKFSVLPASYEFADMLSDAVNLNLVRIGGKEIDFQLTLDSAIPCGLYGDETRVKQILNNLLSNAFKYTDKGSVRLSISCVRQDEDAWLTFVVSDTGRGMRKEDLGKLFTEYWQFGMSGNRSIEGIGLGLSICRSLVEMMDGTIQVESEFGVGSTFTVTFRQQITDGTPLDQETINNLRKFRFIDQERNKTAALSRSYMPYASVLVVDDVPTNLDVVRGLLRPYGLRVDCVTSGKEAIEAIRKKEVRYDLVFMDHMMPEMDGIEAARIIRGEIGTEYAKTVPMIMLTANAVRGNEEMFLASGFNAYISKPVDVIQLDRELNRWIRDKQKKETLELAEKMKQKSPQKGNISKPALLSGFQVEGANLQEGVRYYGDEETYIDILRSWVLHTPKLLEQLRRVDGDDLAQYLVAVHALKGSSYGIRAEKVGDLAGKLESAARNGDIAAVLAGNGSLLETTETLIADLTGILDSLTAQTPKKTRLREPDRILLQKMKEASEHFRTHVMESLLKEFEDHDYDSGGELVAGLRHKVDNLEYHDIARDLEVWLKND
ncbi:MAG: response regulator [Synergistaceae bacterium]|jgi:signal transduction histidine kinase/CheY-like chemotaxis protein/HPt (histidine-containing phosphotransfer) domain-containing protein|nr:response regulator [Synergistaceae bacterium]